MDTAQEQWKEVIQLGQGGFGCVYLYKNQTTNQCIAVKKCRKKDDIQPKVAERWQMEVSIMGKLNHENVIKSIEVPEALKTTNGSLPALGMEFCEGGDLRKVLNQPQNCFGLKESQVRQLTSGVGSAIEYLHNHRIIHRDLKPENIVLQPLENNKVLYKIIDLGYAKELDMNSICNSLVGTQQYLAPELQRFPSYTKTVDYWSFGCLVFECITGFRPFSHTSPRPIVLWYNEIEKKSPEDIWAEYDAAGKIKFSKKLPTENHLCKPLQLYMEQWLGLMLRWDPKMRGGGVLTENDQERPKCFCRLEQIVSMKMIHVLYVETNKVYTFCINETHMIDSVHKVLHKYSNIPPEEQVLILPNGNRLDSSRPALEAYCDPISEELNIFLFRKGQMVVGEKKRRSIPQSVRTVERKLREDSLLEPKEQRKACAHTVYWCCGQNCDHNQLLSGYRAIWRHLYQRNELKSKKKTIMTGTLDKFLGCYNMFRKSLTCDLEQHRVISNSIKHTFDTKIAEMKQRWVQRAEHVKTFQDFIEKAKEVTAQDSNFATEISTLLKDTRMETLDEFEKSAKTHYTERISTRAEDDKARKMTDLITNCFDESVKQTKNIYEEMRKITTCLWSLEMFMQKIDGITAEIEEANRQVQTWQKERQTDIWGLLNQSMMMTLEKEQGNPEPETKMPFNTFTGDATAALNMFPQPSMYSAAFLSMSSNLESLRLMDDSRANSKKLEDTMTEMQLQQNDAVAYFSSLEKKPI